MMLFGSIAGLLSKNLLAVASYLELVNTLLENSRKTEEKDLSYSPICLGRSCILTSEDCFEASMKREKFPDKGYLNLLPYEFPQKVMSRLIAHKAREYSGTYKLSGGDYVSN
ncbi:hypothetical protein NC653_022252 [Populus alba x Populus x berolinensis]|uniref:Uncharacterized protein n=1 Tax=Populus alba x Populus x berolinensis TaxID=444605 RepID=A0AAD6MF23_9ROSI|nr:hypothetical protein NC653_022252 [Populus alba x Populus x berolinensis]